MKHEEDDYDPEVMANRLSKRVIDEIMDGQNHVMAAAVLFRTFGPMRLDQVPNNPFHQFYAELLPPKAEVNHEDDGRGGSQGHDG